VKGRTEEQTRKTISYQLRLLLSRSDFKTLSSWLSFWKGERKMFGRRKPSAASSSASTPKRKEERETELLEETRLTKELLEKQLGIDGSVTEKVLNILLQNEVFTIGALLALFQNPDKGEEKLQKLGIGLGSVALIAKFCAGMFLRSNISD